MLNNEQTLDKIRKLLRLGESNNENESAAAIAAAQKLMDKHNISEMMLNINKPDTEQITDERDPLWKGKHSRSQWRSRLASILANANSCKIYLKVPDIHVVGRPSDISSVRYLFAYCEREIERLSSRYKNGKSWANNYKMGICDAIESKLKEARTEARNELMLERGSAAGAAIVRIDNRDVEVVRWMQNHLRLGKGKTFGRNQHDASARAVGQRDGSNINLGASKAIAAGLGRLKK